MLPKPNAVFAEHRQRLDLAADRLGPAVLRSVERKKAGVAALALRPGALVERVRASRERLNTRGGRLGVATLALTRVKQRALDAVAARMSLSRLNMRISDGRTRSGQAMTALERAMQRRLERQGERLSRTSRTLEALSYQRVLDRGFAVVRDADGGVVSASATVAAGQALGR